MIIYHSNKGNLLIAKSYYEAGINIIPLKCNGSKQPKIKFTKYLTQRFPWYQVSGFFTSLGSPSGIGVLCGSTSGNLEVLDFDINAPVIFPAWCKAVAEKHPLLLKRLVLIRTPKNGCHIWYRCPVIEGNQKLAMSEEYEVNDKPRIDTLIETRGQGGYVCAPGSPPQTHSLNKQYQVVSGDPFNIPTITEDERQTMLDIARSFNEYIPADSNTKIVLDCPAEKKIDSSLFETLYGTDWIPTGRPGDDFNQSADWEDILCPHDWTIIRTSGDTTFWRKPGSFSNSHHATTNYNGCDLLHIFSTSIPGFEAGKTYSKFAAFAILEHSGNFSGAARCLSTDGYGSNYIEVDETIISNFEDQLLNGGTATK